MQRIANVKAHSIGLRSDERLELPSANHFKQASISKEAAATIKAHGLKRVAGNWLICESTRDFWKLKDGKVLRVTSVEVDNGESIRGANPRNPRAFLDELLSDLSL